MSISLARRKFLIKLGWAAGGITVVGLGARNVIPPLPTFSKSDPEDIQTWVQLNKNGKILFYLPRAEMGQGISTGLSQIVAEELNVPLSQVDCHYQSTAVMAPCKMTVGSQSIENYWRLTALSAALLREHVRSMAAEHFSIPAIEVLLVEGGFENREHQQISFAELVNGASIVLSTDAIKQTVDLFTDRPIDERRIVGKTAVPVNIDRIITGKEIYSRDKNLFGMLHGQIAHPPQLGAKLLSFHRAAAESVVNVIAVVVLDQQVGVIANTPMAAIDGIAALNTSWRSPDLDDVNQEQRDMDIDVAIKNGTLDHEFIDKGSVEKAAKKGGRSLSLRYDTPMVAHAAMEPRSAVASFHRNDQQEHVCEIWTGCQDPWLVRSVAADLLSMSRSKVIVHNLRIGGAFGGRVLCQASIEAAWMSKAVGKPVKVQWSREDEFRYNYVGPQFSTRIDVGLSDEGRIGYWHHRAIAAPILTSS